MENKFMTLVKKGMNGIVKATSASSNVAGQSRYQYQEMEKCLYVYPDRQNGFVGIAYKDGEEQFIDIQTRELLDSNQEYEPFCATKYEKKALPSAAKTFYHFLEWYANDYKNDSLEELEILSKLGYSKTMQQKKEKQVSELKLNLRTIRIATIGGVNPDLHVETIRNGIRTHNVTAEHVAEYDKDVNPYYQVDGSRKFAYLANGYAYVLDDFSLEGTSVDSSAEPKNRILTGNFTKYPIFTPDRYDEYQPGSETAMLENQKAMSEIMGALDGANVAYIYKVWKAFASANEDFVKIEVEHIKPPKHLLSI